MTIITSVHLRKLNTHKTGLSEITIKRSTTGTLHTHNTFYDRVVTLTKCEEPG